MDVLEIISDDGEGSTVEEGVNTLTLREGETALIFRPDMTYRLVVPSLPKESEVPGHTLALIALALLAKNDEEWLEEAIERVFGDVSEVDFIPEDLGPKTKGSA